LATAGTADYPEDEMPVDAPRPAMIVRLAARHRQNWSWP
jgi:hypothetical protein